jgi:hypothetical protein
MAALYRVAHSGDRMTDHTHAADRPTDLHTHAADQPHLYVTLGTAPHAEIDEHDPRAHTRFLLLACAPCHAAFAFPKANLRLCTDRYKRQLRADLARHGWTLEE